jgi:hypothetical protein
MRTFGILVAVSLVATLSACSEKPQFLGGNKKDAPAYTGAKNPYVEKGWTAGDKTSWEMQLRARAQNQNEYTKTE